MKFLEQDKISSPPSSPWKKTVQLLLKLGLTVLCFWYISTKIDYATALKALMDASWLLLLAATLVYAVSKLVAAHRLKIYFNQWKLQLSNRQNFRLYWLGMFYNLFLPGSISGDAYKVILLNKKLEAPIKKTSIAVLLDRFSGLLGIGILLAIYGLMVLDKPWLAALLILGCVAAIVAFYAVIHRFFKEFTRSFWSTLGLGLLVQAIQAAGVYLIIASLPGTTHLHQWIFIFLAASVISVLPISLGGGLGTREVVFAEGAVYFGLDAHIGVIISLLFYLTSVVASLPGAWFIFFDPLKNRRNSGPET